MIRPEPRSIFFRWELLIVAEINLFSYPTSSGKGATLHNSEALGVAAADIRELECVCSPSTAKCRQSFPLSRWGVRNYGLSNEATSIFVKYTVYVKDVLWSFKVKPECEFTWHEKAQLGERLPSQQFSSP